MGRLPLAAVAVAVLALGACGEPDAVRPQSSGSSSLAPAVPATAAAVSTTAGSVATTPSPGEATSTTAVATASAGPAETTLAPVDGPLAFCDDEPPPMDRRGQGASAADQKIVAQWAVFADLAVAHPDELTGAVWDDAAGQVVVLAPDVAAARPLVATATPQGARVRIERAARSYGELVALSQKLVQAANDADLAHASGVRMDGRLALFIAVRDRATVDALAELAGDDAGVVCLAGGADPATVVPRGPQAMTGDGWRLLLEPGARRAGPPIAVAASPAEYDALWSARELPGAPPPVDFAAEVVVAFVNGESPGCQNLFTGLTFAGPQRTVRASFVLPGGERPCTAIAATRTYVVAVRRDRLPAVPFRIVNHGDQCLAGCAGDPLEVVRL